MAAILVSTEGPVLSVDTTLLEQSLQRRPLDAATWSSCSLHLPPGPSRPVNLALRRPPLLCSTQRSSPVSVPLKGDCRQEHKV